MATTKPAKPAPWKRKRPAGAARTKLSAEVIAMARARAERAGRRYPNLIDNMWAAQQQKSQKA